MLFVVLNMKYLCLLYFLTINFLDKIVCDEATIYSPVIELKQGKLKGFQETSLDGKPFYSFLGIPYAKPPLENLSFEDPTEPERWDGVLLANKMPEMCLQVAMLDSVLGNAKASGKEDCLNLNVFTTKPLNPDENLAVMVFIHGGGYACGAASEYPPYVLLNEDIVLVVIQYRLGVFGFLSTEDSTMPGNLGMKDQRMALKWVQENIKNFGGDPEKVTIFGESAGGSSVHLHTLSPGSKGLFKSVIAQSGLALCPWGYGDHHRKYAELIGEKTGCSLKNSSATFKECLKNMDRTQLVLQAQSAYEWGITPLIYNPRVDGDFLPDDPIRLLESGKYNKVNLMAGITRDEGTFVLLFMKVNRVLENQFLEEFNKYARYAMMIENEPNAANLSRNLLKFYLKGKKLEDSPVDELIAMFSDATIRIHYDLTTFIQAHEKNLNLYLYEFNHRGQRSVVDQFGVDIPNKYISHVDDLYYLFTGGALVPFPFEREEDIEVRKKVLKLWTNFAKYGNPTPLGSFDFTWNKATASTYEHLSITTSPKMKGYSRKETLDFWRTLNIKKRSLFRYADTVLGKKDEL